MDTPAQPWLLTPGPLTTSLKTKQAMLSDLGSWDEDFNKLTESVCHQLRDMISGGNDFVCIPVQGSGTFAVEAAIGSCIPPSGKALVLMNGAYGQRIAKILSYLGRSFVTLDKGDYLPPLPEDVHRILSHDPEITDVIVVHCETSSGILNPVQDIGRAVKKYGKRFHIDAMSTLGGVPLDCREIPFDLCISSANKCIEGVPGFGFVLVKEKLITQCEGISHSLSLDLWDQWTGFKKTSKWRFTPPTHVVLAFARALEQHREEGGVGARCARYIQNRTTLVTGMKNLGFRTLLEDQWLSPVITTFLNPGDEKFSFPDFYRLMKERNFLIYPGKLTIVDSFRMGHIGHIDSAVMEKAVEAVRESLQIMGISTGKPSEPLKEHTAGIFRNHSSFPQEQPVPQ